jgi:hypothetical protein
VATDESRSPSGKPAPPNSTLEVVAGASHALPLAVADKILEQLAP